MQLRPYGSILIFCRKTRELPVMDPLGTLIDWIAEYGIFGLLALGLAERFIPVLPSYGVLVAIGIATGNGDWTVLEAISGTVLGSVVGCIAFYAMAISFSEERSYRFLYWVGRMIGLSQSRVDKTVTSFRANQRILAFGMQLVPTIRLISPIIAGLFRADAKAFSFATLAGILVWNCLFIGVGHFAEDVAPDANSSTLALQVLVVLILTELAAVLLWRWFHRSRQA
ncbi:MAG: VTT domain-containing protein [Pseudohongiella sp.]|nr:VTT domain-containing protein [Pseudohongiella sp.]MDP2126813.1 VTT domain-containing protein [Pseudohongiella sp.]